MKVLVTGATGFVGSAVARAALGRGHDVRVLVRPESDRRNIVGLDVETVEGDLNDSESLVAACRGCDGLFHVAADYRLWVRNADAMMRTNVEGTFKLLKTAIDTGVSRIVYTSSVATLGLNADGTPANEETPVSITDMIGPYKRSKFLAEEAVQKLIAETGAAIVIVNPSTPIGPGDIKPTPTGRMVVEAAAGKMPAYVDTGLNIVHVDDVAAGHLLAFEKGIAGQRYVLGGENLSLKAILSEIAHLSGRPAPRFKIPHDLILPIAFAAEAWTRLSGGDEPFVTIDGVRMAKKKMFFASDKAETELGYSHRPATKAISYALSWFRENGYLNR
jgi:dihydroflavonol-4-reductase